jgi:lysophospholipase L1-like esterase
MWFRITLGITGLLCWILTISLATHRSGSTTVLGRYSFSLAAMLAAAGALAVFLTVAHWGPVFRRLYAARHKIIVLAVTVAVAFLFFEMFLRIFDPLGLSWYQESTRYQLQRVSDPDLIYRHPPGHSGHYQGVDVSFNELGLRDRPIGAKAGDEFRVLFLGDSITFGWGVEVEKTFPRVLEVELQKGSAGTVRTINSGVGSYNTTQELGFLRRHGDSLAPDLVLLVYHPNDVNTSKSPEAARTERSFRGKKPHEMVNLLLRRLWSYRLFLHTYKGRTQRTSADPESPGWRRSMESVEAMAAYCRERGIPFAAFLWRIGPDPVSDALDTDLSTLSDRVGFPYADAQQWYAGHGLIEVTNSLVDPHPNAEGHELFALGLAGFLEEQGLLAEEASGPASDR